MLGRLQAEEALAAMSQMAAGTGAMPEADQRDYRRQLLRDAHGGRIPAQRATVASLQQMGIQVVTRD